MNRSVVFNPNKASLPGVKAESSLLVETPDPKEYSSQRVQGNSVSSYRKSQKNIHGDIYNIMYFG